MDYEKEAKNDHEKEHGPIVKITVDGNEIHIHRGHRSVAEIKQAGNIPLAFDLEQVVDGKLTFLPDDGSLTIKGGEVFVSHPKDSSSS